ncbi:MAG: hypothetical protein ACOYM4_18460 [Nodosilinea sp.]
MSKPALLKLYAADHSPPRPMFVYLPGMDGSGELFGLQSTGLKSHFDIRCLVIPGDDRSSWRVWPSRWCS